MYGQYRKIDPAKVLKLKSQGLSCVQIARRLNVSVAAVSLVFCARRNRTPWDKPDWTVSATAWPGESGHEPPETA